jgi:hypothetical protein
VQNYSRSIEFNKQQVQSLESSVDIAGQVFKAAFAGAVEPV